MRSLHTPEDFRLAARRRLPKGLFDFIDRGTEGEFALDRSRRAYDEMTLMPRALIDVSRRHVSIDLFGKKMAMPLAIAPTGAAGLLWHQGEIELARAARAEGIPFSVATGAITSLEEIAEKAGGRLWFQLYMWPDRSLSHELVHRAEAAGYEALIVTVDTVVTPNRSYNARNGFSIPMKANRRVVADLARRPGWLFGVMARYMLAGGMPRHENYPAALRVPITAGVVANPKNETLDWADLMQLRRLWKGPMIVKGILHPADARRAVDCGADGLIVSNHGGRNFDSAPAPLAILPPIVDVVNNRAAVMIDGGICRGSDIAKALALGATCALAGRLPLWGLAAGGEAGVARVLAMFREDLSRTLAFVGVTDPSSLRGVDRGISE
nr:alpha-hydroxy acid oxidase [Sphingomonas sp. Y57]